QIAHDLGRGQNLVQLDRFVRLVGVTDRTWAEEYTGNGVPAESTGIAAIVAALGLGVEATGGEEPPEGQNDVGADRGLHRMVDGKGRMNLDLARGQRLDQHLVPRPHFHAVLTRNGPAVDGEDALVWDHIAAPSATDAG